MFTRQSLIPFTTTIVVAYLCATGQGQGQGQTSIGPYRSPSHRHHLSHPKTQQSHLIRDPAHLPAVHHAVNYAPPRKPAESRIAATNDQTVISPASWGPSHTRILPRFKPCRLTRCHHCGVPAEPLGASLQASMDQQVYNGQKARLVMYEYDFRNGQLEDQAAMNLAGRQKLQRLLPLMEMTGLPLVVEAVPDRPELSETRRIHVVNSLEAEFGFSNADSRVVVQMISGPGIRGVEAVEIDRGQLETTRSQGITFSGFDSSGFDQPQN